MAMDAGMIASCVFEIKRDAVDAKIEKVLAPSPDEFVFVMHTKNGTRRLSLCLGDVPRLCFTEQTKENPLVPPMFCMYLRKRLVGARLVDVSLMGFDRIVDMTLLGRDEMGFESHVHVICELMGKYANVIVTDKDNVIRGVYRPVSLSCDGGRALLGGMVYNPPENAKTNPLTVTREAFDGLYQTDLPADRFLLSTFSGLGKTTATQIAFNAFQETDKILTDGDRDALYAALCHFKSIVTEGRFENGILSHDGKQLDYAFFPVTSMGTWQPFPSASRCIEVFLSQKIAETAHRQLSGDLTHLLQKHVNRLAKKLEKQREEAKGYDDAPLFKTNADLIMSNLYLLKKGMTSAVLTDYAETDEQGDFKVKTVALNSRLSPVDNAQAYYKKYAKAKAGKEALAVQIAKSEEELAYLETVCDGLTRAEGTSDIAQIKAELRAEGFITSSPEKGMKKKPSAEGYKTYVTADGYTVLCGRNNLQNDHLTFTVAEKTDYWFHVKDAPGSHVILLCHGEEPPASTFTEAAEIAAFNSSLHGQGKVDVDYAFVKSIKKPPKARPGYVIYYTNWSCTVTPKEGKLK